MLAAIPDWLTSILHFLWAPLQDTPWRFWIEQAVIGGETIAQPWRNWWLRLVFDDRYVVCYFLPLVPILLLFSRRHLRAGIIFTGLLFLAYVFGAFYAVFWLLMCVAFYFLSEKFAVESRRKDVLPWAPPLAAAFCIAGWYLFTQAIQHAKIPELTNWLFVNFPWVYPLGVRGLPGREFMWEPFISGMYPPEIRTYDAPAPLFFTIFTFPHVIGTAYFTIRMLHYFVEIKRNGIPPDRRTLLNFLAYLCYAPNLIQGPIERYNDFQAEMDSCHQRRRWSAVPPAFVRIGWGILKCLIGLWYFRPLIWEWVDSRQLYYQHPEQIPSYALLYFGVYLQIFWLYLEFSGYCDVSAGIARLLGYRQIENFRWCWLATSLRDFWRRWHISLSAILRDYIYIPLGGSRTGHTVRNLMITFALCGLWHAPIFKMAAWGVVMGLMLAANQWWVQWMKRLDEQPERPLAALRRTVVRLRPLPQIVSWAFTMHCFVMSLLIFFGGTGAIRVGWELLRRPLNALLASQGVNLPPLPPEP